MINILCDKNFLQWRREIYFNKLILLFLVVKIFNYSVAENYRNEFCIKWSSYNQNVFLVIITEIVLFNWNENKNFIFLGRLIWRWCTEMAFQNILNVPAELFITEFGDLPKQM